MMPIEFTVTRQGLELTAKWWRYILSDAWEHAGAFWHRNILPKHFTTAGAAEYGYAKRTKNYMIRKARKQGHQVPMVWSGATRKAAIRTRDVRVTSTGARVVLRGLPAYIWQSQYRNAGGGSRWGTGQPNMVKELMTISEGDAKAVAQVMDRFITRRAKTGGLQVTSKDAA